MHVTQYNLSHTQTCHQQVNSPLGPASIDRAMCHSLCTETPSLHHSCCCHPYLLHLSCCFTGTWNMGQCSYISMTFTFLAWAQSWSAPCCSHRLQRLTFELVDCSASCSLFLTNPCFCDCIGSCCCHQHELNWAIVLCLLSKNRVSYYCSTAPDTFWYTIHYTTLSQIITPKGVVVAMSMEDWAIVLSICTTGYGSTNYVPQYCQRRTKEHSRDTIETLKDTPLSQNSSILSASKYSER